MQIGRLLGDNVGTLVPANHLGIGTPVPGGRFAFLPTSPRDDSTCGGTDKAGDLFIDVVLHEHPAGAFAGARGIAYGVLGPDAVSVTYRQNGRIVTERTGPDGGYIAVVPGTAILCAASECFAGSTPSEMTTPILQAGIIASVRYRNGQLCRLETFKPGSIKAPPAPGSAVCPNVGYVH